jgi:hypothetical protein
MLWTEWKDRHWLQLLDCRVADWGLKVRLGIYTWHVHTIRNRHWIDIAIGGVNTQICGGTQTLPNNQNLILALTSF